MKTLSQFIKESYESGDGVKAIVRLMSNYDCMNSTWTESQSGFYYKETYLGDAIDALNLNPAKVAELLRDDYDNPDCVGDDFPDMPERNGKELVGYGAFIAEIGNMASGANVLVFAVSVDEDTLGAGSVTLPAGTLGGMFDSFNGGGSLMELELKKPLSVKLGGNSYPYWRIERDGDCGYSVQDVYGFDDEYFTEVK